MKEYIVRVYNYKIEWFNQEGKRHREDGPAAEWNDGSRFWYLNGKLHREDGPAIEFSDGGEEWYLNGEEYTEEEFKKKTESCDGRVIEIDGKKYKLVGV